MSTLAPDTFGYPQRAAARMDMLAANARNYRGQSIRYTTRICHEDAKNAKCLADQGLRAAGVLRERSSCFASLAIFAVK